MNEKSARSALGGEIERNLKRAFDDVASQQLPDRLLGLLEQLKAGQQPPAANREKAEGDD